LNVVQTGVLHVPATQPLPAVHAPQSTVRMTPQLSIAVRPSHAVTAAQNSMSVCAVHESIGVTLASFLSFELTEPQAHSEMNKRAPKCRIDASLSRSAP
jgi:hypothetical protein